MGYVYGYVYVCAFCKRSQTIDLLVKASNLPLSIVIVGVGQADFSVSACLVVDNSHKTDKNSSGADVVEYLSLIYPSSR